MAVQDNKSATKVLTVLDVLMRNFAYGFSNSELAKETGFSASDITRYVACLEKAGFAERIAENGRVRVSVRFARCAVQILNSLNSAEQQIASLQQRINRG